MGKKYRRKKNGRGAERLFIGIIAALVLLIIAGIVISVLPGESGGYVVSDDGHIHDAQGNHLADYEELFGDANYTITEDGHVHDENGNHIGDLDEILGNE